MTQPDYEAFFDRYAEAYRQSLDGPVQVETLSGFFTETSLALVPGGGVQPATRAELGPLFGKMYAFYKTVGTTGLTVDRVEVAPIADGHDRAEVFYRAEYDRRGETLILPFSVTYLLQRTEDVPRIFAFIAGDEQGLMREHGLIDDQGNPVG